MVACGGGIENGALWWLEEALEGCALLLLLLDIKAGGEEYTAIGAFGEEKRLMVLKEELLLLAGDLRCCWRRESCIHGGF